MDTVFCDGTIDTSASILSSAPGSGSLPLNGSVSSTYCTFSSSSSGKYIAKICISPLTASSSADALTSTFLSSGIDHTMLPAFGLLADSSHCSRTLNISLLFSTSDNIPMLFLRQHTSSFSISAAADDIYVFSPYSSRSTIADTLIFLPFIMLMLRSSSDAVHLSVSPALSPSTDTVSPKSMLPSMLSNPAPFLSVR